MDNFWVRIETADNGFVVELPDLAERKKKEDEAKKSKLSAPYLGDCTEKRVAKTVDEVTKIVTAALKSLPDIEYDEAFKEASKGKDGGLRSY